MPLSQMMVKPTVLGDNNIVRAPKNIAIQKHLPTIEHSEQAS